MDRTINYQITEEADGLRIEQFLRHQGYSYQHITQLKKMPESILIRCREALGKPSGAPVVLAGFGAQP